MKRGIVREDDSFLRKKRACPNNGQALCILINHEI